MGVVYEARDLRLKRTVAIKLLPPELTRDEAAKQRFIREAQAAAALNHPNICALHDIGEQDGSTFLVMERLEGETLAERIAQGTLPLQDSLRHGIVLLETLARLHERDLVHRDVKPSNVFLTAHGLKLLDFGLARSLTPDDDATRVDLTQPGVLLGTLRYMAPEALGGQAVDHRADLFAVGTVLYEMLVGTPAFAGTSVEAAHAVLHETPAALTGSDGIIALDRAIHRALAKRPGERYPSAEAMVADLRRAQSRAGSATAVTVHPITRLIVLPFRLLRPDSKIDFLAFSLPDAVANALSGLESLVVRSSVLASQLGTEPDLKRVASEAEVDLALMCTMLRAGDAVRVSAQLLEVPAGTLLWSHTMQVEMRDLFQVQDELTGGIVASLSPRLTLRDRQAARKDEAATAAAYEYYLRATALFFQVDQFRVARDLYLKCVQEDPNYAPAWARLGRMHRVVGKYFEQTTEDGPEASYQLAEQAFEHALELSPDLPIVHSLLTGLEVERGRAMEAMIRLIEQARRGDAAPDLFAGLVLSCRYCGLLEASIAADEQARRLDPKITTSVGFSLLLAGFYERGVEAARATMPDTVFKSECLLKLGRGAETVEELEHGVRLEGHMSWWCSGYLAIIRDERESAVEQFVRLFDELPGDDPEAHYIVAKAFARLGQNERALTALEQGVVRGYYPHPAMLCDPWFESLHGAPAFTRILDRAHDRYDDARTAYVGAGGDDVLGTRTA